ncbi:MAG: hypothetical protein IKC95_01375 [Oscillospiraceae bacterium]|nr:hypothetical protein [Oscillospiraceae bacterium]
MALPCYLAMTAAEFAAADVLPAFPAWMACHFSSYGTGLSNLPADLPKKAIIILNDRIPISGHDPTQISQEMCMLYDLYQPDSFLLDFQRPQNPETVELVKALCHTLPCPVGVTECYAQGIDCPVFLSPPPLYVPLAEHLAPWENREVWLEVALDSQTIRLTPEGNQIQNGLLRQPDTPIFQDHTLHCHYHIILEENAASFFLSRKADDLLGLLEEAEAFCVTRAVGLYQQLKNTALQKNTFH